MTSIGFHVWNPAGRLPTYTHPTFLAAWAEKDRLQALHPDQRFIVMMPCEDMSAIGYGLGFTRGREEGRRDADLVLAELRALRRRMAALDPLRSCVDEHQAVVADCLLWFDGFAAAYAGKESYERPATPNRENIRALNAALQRVMRAEDEKPEPGAYRALRDDEIPF